MKRFLLLTFIAISFIACKKDNGNPPSTGKKLLSKVVDSYNGITTAYSYNDKNQLIKVHESSKYTPLVQDFVLAYNADGTLKRLENAGQYSYDYLNFSYSNGVPTGINRIFPSNPAVNSAIVLKTNEPGTISGMIYSYVNGNEYVINDVAFEYLNGNLVKSTSKDLGEFSSGSVYEYGDKKSPYLYSGDMFNMFNAFYMFTRSMMPLANKNEIIKETHMDFSETTTYVYSYTYDSDGYPTKANVESTYIKQNVPEIQSGTIEYTYINAK
ncbi:hypothetical protein [Mucilaginibacter aquariorum]|uniref:DUF4595 domain-containing protein n=1 Tax=Mucilaginibacter aquariorum TaxID=2967225 RepID=A0ABT1SWY1_9SPHI|nr:hypothetical protein [Mucilaginibacter aquariorum]MCQ6956705.1 hypothetical protein [Mucilaginibacter aquariorum]